MTSEEHPRSGSAALAVAEGLPEDGRSGAGQAQLRAGPVRPRKSKSITAVVAGRLEYIAALDKPVPADLSGEWFGDAVDERRPDRHPDHGPQNGGANYEGTLVDKLGLIPAGTQLLDAVRTGDNSRSPARSPSKAGC